MTVSAVFGAGNKEYVITDTDALWLGRMVVGEGGYNASTEKIRALLWAIMNRFMLNPSQRKKDSLTAVVRAFSQPINPRWDGEGSDDFCAPGGKYHGTDYCSDSRLERREKMTELSWSKIPLKIRAEIEKLRRGELPYPKAMKGLKAAGKPFRIANWASYPSVRTKFPWGTDVDGDWFFEDEGTIKKDVTVNGTVPRMSDLGFATLPFLGGVALGGGFAFIAYQIAKRWIL